MKQKLRLISFLLTVCVLSLELVSCNPAPGPSVSTTPSGGQSQLPGQRSDLAYTLTQADVDALLASIEKCEHLFLNCAPTEAELQEALDDVDSRYTHISTQAQLAYIYYCLDQTGEQASQDYLFATAAQSDCYERYNEMCKRIDDSASPNRDFFFGDWSEEELEEMRGYSAEMTEISRENNELLVAYRELDDAGFMNGAAYYYLQVVQNNNRLAELNGYENYWDYAYDLYNRDYGSEELETMRSYVRQYLIPLMESAIGQFSILYSSLSRSEQQMVQNLLGEDYDTLTTDYIAAYTASYDNAAHKNMQSLFEPENSFFTDSDASHKGAFTVWLYENERPVCYFGPGYQTVTTVVHEMGHYYAALVNDGSTSLLDLAEAQSQGSEWMFLSFLGEQFSPMVSQVILLNQLLQSLSTILLCTAVDEFEQRCYTTRPESVEDLNEIAADVVAGYGGAEWFSYYIADFPMYWRMVVLENPVYYISYAVSMLAALQIYCVAEEQSYGAGQSAYLKLVEADPESTFIEALAEAGLGNPLTDASVYEAICRLME